MCISYIPTKNISDPQLQHVGRRAAGSDVLPHKKRSVPGTRAKGDAVYGESSTARRVLVLRRKRESALGRQFPYSLRTGLLQILCKRDKRSSLRRQSDCADTNTGRRPFSWRTVCPGITTTRNSLSTFSALHRRLTRCSSSAIATRRAVPLALKVANWTIKNMQDPSGYFYYRRYEMGIVNKTPTLHWGQATMFCALSGLYKILQ